MKAARRKRREVLTRKQALTKLALVLKDVDSGEMGIRAACRKHKFPLWKYSYWKNHTDEVKALKSEDPNSTEVLVDTSGAVVRERLKTIEDLKTENARLTGENFILEQENKKLKERLIRHVLES